VIPLRAGDVLLAAGVSALTTFVLAKCAARFGLVDDARDAPERKHHARAVPLVGGVSLAAALAASIAWRGTDVVGGEVLPGIAFDAPHVLAALGLALAVGTADDFAPRGLPVLPKLAGQMLASIVLALGLHVAGNPPAWPGGIVCVAAGVAAQNAANTFDNADGALCAVASAGLVCAAPFSAASSLWGAVVAFLPFNLSPPDPSRGGGARIPRAWLGDGGSHFLGILLLTTPVAWAALALPLLDLLRVAWVRAKHGEPVWRGDRRHLAHLLEARGWTPVKVALALVGLSIPAIAAAFFCLRT
jgi:UDP-N-acetylmuramyl pentapeptide phosphotransferase/UDP-N-acetylglucosamine-1-phosphate transferase